ncbi:MAG TPA: agmatine deiminase family protein [Methanomassiliicoccales archaeon]|nr:agmatine deiminase family protein [Methanomassiliicoccales archaeon]
MKTPCSLGYYMPAEWSKHEATWLSWPKNPLTFPPEVLGEVEEIFAHMTAALSGAELVKILVDDAEAEEHAFKKVAKAGADMGKVRFLHIKSADVWIRDYGPTFLLHRQTGKRAAVKWQFNAWGGKYDDLLYDDVTGKDVVESSGSKYFEPGIVMEGGAIDVNGQGMVLTTEQCLLNKNRNPHLDRHQIEEYLHRYISTTDVVWLSSGIEGDDTDGHVDDFARFASSTAVLCAHSDKGENAPVLCRNWKILEQWKDRAGLELQRLPMPAPLYLEEEERNLPASYANFYIGNKVVLLPVFNDPQDRNAIDIVSSFFPGREIVPIMARELVYGYGGIHCVTQQEPAERD